VSGLRIRHAEVTNRILTIVDRSRPYTVPLACDVCGVTHLWKTYHIELDDEGSAIVSPEAWAMIERIPAHGFSFTNEVRHPPAKTIGLGVRRG
jgi:hypothetical protein